MLICVALTKSFTPIYYSGHLIILHILVFATFVESEDESSDSDLSISESSSISTSSQVSSPSYSSLSDSDFEVEQGKHFLGNTDQECLRYKDT